MRQFLLLPGLLSLHALSSNWLLGVFLIVLAYLSDHKPASFSWRSANSLIFLRFPVGFNSVSLHLNLSNFRLVSVEPGSQTASSIRFRRRLRGGKVRIGWAFFFDEDTEATHLAPRSVHFKLPGFNFDSLEFRAHAR